ncbi:hypothetical protein Tco_1510361, partial [Tanacetum coccineum]
MLDSEHSMVTYTSISSDDRSLDIGSLGVIIYKYDGLPMMSEDLYAYVEAAMHEIPPPNYVPEPIYPKFMPPEDDVFPVEEQPLPVAVSPTADSPGYITEFDPEEDDEDPEEDPADYPTDRDDDEEEESSRDDVDDEEEDEGDDEKEEHLASDDSVPPPQTGTRGARMTVQPQPPMAASTKALIAAVAATLQLPSPPPSPLTSYSSPLPQ